MSDIFISYSRNDQSQAHALAEKLRAIGMKVWMDQESLIPSEQWATEVVEAICECSAFLVLLSASSVESHNVLKELSLASEKRKRVIPIDLDPTELPASFQYALAGIQKVGIKDIDGICSAIKKGPARIMVRDQKKSLMVLPFEDLSPTQDNAWFADGLMSELISSLSNIRSLRLIDEKTSRDFRNVKVKILDIAREYEVRYFIEGSVRKFGDEIKINVQLLDSQEGEHLWTYSQRGAFAEIFDIQEKVAKKVVEGLKLKLTTEEAKKIEDRGTENAEAYELYVKAGAFSVRSTKEGILYALSLLTEALHLDANFARAMVSKSQILSDLYRSYERKQEHLIEAEQLVKKALELRPDLWRAYEALSEVNRVQGNYELAEEAALEYVRHAPDDNHSHFSLALLYSDTDRPLNAIVSYETALGLRPDDLNAYWNIVINCDRAAERAKRIYWATEALAYYEKTLELHPDDENNKVRYANLLYSSEKYGEARAYLATAGELSDGQSLYNISCLQIKLGEFAEAMKSLRRSVDKGFSNLEDFHSDRDLAPLRDMPEFRELMRQLENKSSEKQNQHA